MSQFAIASLHKDPRERILVIAQLVSSALQISHSAFPNARLFAVSNVIDAFTLLFAPSVESLTDVHRTVTASLSIQRDNQAMRLAELVAASSKNDANADSPSSDLN